MNYDIYRTVSDSLNNKLKNNLIIGGFTDFDNAAQAVHTLTRLDDIEREARAHSQKYIPPIAIYVTKECTHKASDDRMRSSTKHDAIDDKHRPTNDPVALTYARHGMAWKAGEPIPHE